MYAFVHIEKTAGRTIRAILQRSFGAGHCEIRTPYARRAGDVRDQRVHVTADDLRRCGASTATCAASPATTSSRTRTSPTRAPGPALLHLPARSGAALPLALPQSRRHATAARTSSVGRRGLDARLADQDAGRRGQRAEGHRPAREPHRLRGPDRDLRRVAADAGRSGSASPTSARSIGPSTASPTRAARATSPARTPTSVTSSCPRCASACARSTRWTSRCTTSPFGSPARASGRRIAATSRRTSRRCAQRNQQITDLDEPLSGRLLRNWVYKPALVLRLA